VLLPALSCPMGFLNDALRSDVKHIAAPEDWQKRASKTFLDQGYVSRLPSAVAWHLSALSRRGIIGHVRPGSPASRHA